MKKVGKVMWRAIIEVVKFVVRRIGYKNRLESKIDMLSRRLIRLEIIDAIKRKDTATVFLLFDEYTAIGGNSYISFMVEKYKKDIKKKRSKKC